jgi:hypothetical protein
MIVVCWAYAVWLPAQSSTVTLVDMAAAATARVQLVGGNVAHCSIPTRISTFKSVRNPFGGVKHLVIMNVTANLQKKPHVQTSIQNA